MTLPTYFMFHGGGPWPFMNGPMRQAHATLEAALRDMPRQIGVKPRAVLMVSAHWEAAEFTVLSGAHPGMFYDYGGFPDHTYEVRYEAPGAPELAVRVQSLVTAAGLRCDANSERGFDHGVFAPMAVIYPEADVPVVQLSMKQSYDPRAHLALGGALAPLRDEGVLIIGSGSSFNNASLRGSQSLEASWGFDNWLASTLLDTPPAERRVRIANWTEAPSARLVHPHEDHLLPLMVALGAAGEDRAYQVYHEERFMRAIVVSSYRFDRA